MKNYSIHLILCILCSMLLTACGDNVTGYWEETNDIWPSLSPQEGQRIERKCIAADDFGYPKFNVDAKPTNSADILGSRENQVVVWNYSGYEVTSNQLLVGTSGRWTSWFGDAATGIAPYTSICKLAYDTTDNACPDIRQNDNSLRGGGPAAYMLANDTENFNAPCWFTFGYGAYLLFAGPGSNPNGGEPPQISLLRSPSSPTLHLFGDNYDVTNNSAYYGDALLEVPAGVALARTEGRLDIPGSRIWSKILDRYYDDNDGGYTIKIKSGARVPGDGPIASLIKLIRNMLYDAAEKMYSNIVSDPTFRSAVWGLLTLYVIISAIAYLFGFAKVTQADIVIRIVKVGIIAQLLSPQSWEWFNYYLFTPFTYGVNDFICIVVDAAVPGMCQGGMGIDVFDNMLKQFFSAETHAKASSALFYGGGAGIVYVIMIYTAIIVFLIMIVKTLFAFLIAYIPTALLITIAPFFICFMLFERTKHLFDGWLKEMFSYAMQSFLAMAMLGLVAAIIMEMMHRTIGYRVCWKCLWCPSWDILGMKFQPFGGSWYDPDGIKYYLPDIRYTETTLNYSEAYFNANALDIEGQYPGHLGYIYIDADKTKPGLERVFRNPTDFPFLDPATEGDRIRHRLRGGLLSFSLIFAFLIIIYVSYLYSHQIGGIAQEIAGAMRGINVVGMAFGDKALGGRSSGMGMDAIKAAAGAAGATVGRPLLNAAKSPFKTSTGGLEKKLDQFDGADASNYNKTRDKLLAKEIRDAARETLNGDSTGEQKGFDAVFGERASVRDRRGFDNSLVNLLNDYRDVNKSRLIDANMRRMSAAELKQKHGVNSLEEYLEKKRAKDTKDGTINRAVANLANSHFQGKMNESQRKAMASRVGELLNKRDAFTLQKDEDDDSNNTSLAPTGGQPMFGSNLDDGTPGSPSYDIDDDMRTPKGGNDDDKFGATDLGHRESIDDPLTMDDTDLEVGDQQPAQDLEISGDDVFTQQAKEMKQKEQQEAEREQQEQLEREEAQKQQELEEQALQEQQELERQASQLEEQERQLASDEKHRGKTYDINDVFEANKAANDRRELEQRMKEAGEGGHLGTTMPLQDVFDHNKKKLQEKATKQKAQGGLDTELEATDVSSRRERDDIELKPASDQKGKEEGMFDTEGPDGHNYRADREKNREQREAKQKEKAEQAKKELSESLQNVRTQRDAAVAEYNALSAQLEASGPGKGLQARKAQAQANVDRLTKEISNLKGQLGSLDE